MVNQWYDQSDLEQVKAGFELSQALREARRKSLIAQRKIVKEILDAAIEGRRKVLDGTHGRMGLMYDLRDGSPDRGDLEAERFFWSLEDRTFRIESMLNELIHEERRDLEYIARMEDRLRARNRARRYETNDKEEVQGRENGKGLTPRANKNRERSANFAKNRQHKNRASKGHETVSSESPNHNS